MQRAKAKRKSLRKKIRAHAARRKAVRRKTAPARKRPAARTQIIPSFFKPIPRGGPILEYNRRFPAAFYQGPVPRRRLKHIHE